MNPTSFLTGEEHTATLRALQILTGMFWGPHSDACEAMLTEEFFAPFEILAHGLDFDPPETLNAIRAEIGRFANAEALFESLEEDYLRLFIIDRNGIPAPLYASCYEGEHSLLMGEPAIRMKERFAAAGLVLSEGIGEPPDHLSIELEFLYFLLDCGDGDSTRGGVIEAAKFASTTMLPWVSQFSKRLADNGERRFYRLAASLLLSILQFVAGFEPLE